MRFVTIAWRNLFRRPLRTCLTVCGLSVAVAAVVALVGISDGFQRSYIDLLSARHVDLIVQRVGTGIRLNRLLNPKLRGPLLALPGVHEVLPAQLDMVSMPEFDLSSVIAIGWETDSRLLKRLHFIAGRTLAAGDRRHAVIGKVLADNTGRKPGDKLPLYGDEVEIVGVFESPSVYENGALIMPLAEMQRLMDTKLITAFSISVEHPEDSDAIHAVAREIEALDPTLSALPIADFVGTIREMALARAVAWAVSAIALLVGIIGMLNTMAMSVAERVCEIGVLRAIGWKKQRVVTIILGESLLLSLAAAAVGTLTAIALTRFLSTLPQTSGLIRAGVAPAVMLEGLLVALLVGLGGALYPAFWAARLAPTDAMRHK